MREISYREMNPELNFDLMRTYAPGEKELIASAIERGRLSKQKGMMGEEIAGVSAQSQLLPSVGFGFMINQEKRTMARISKKTSPFAEQLILEVIHG